MPQEKKGESARVSKGAEKPQCHVHDEDGDWRVNEIRKNVCVNDLSLTKHADGKYYCLFHLPTREKDIAKFKKIFLGRLDAVKEKIVATEELSDEERSKDNHKIFYDFRYVWFPSEVDLASYKFLSYVDFRFATFSADANFSFATFSASAEFYSAKFLANAYFVATEISRASFISVTFTAVADFRSATFGVDANFFLVTFSANADFSEATFLEDADFRKTTFSADANFTKTKFGKNGSTHFSYTTFAKDTFFDRTRFRNEVSFNSAIFGSESYVIFRNAFFANKVDLRYCCAEGYLIFSHPWQSRKSSFELQHAVFEKASRISFHTVDLRPGWFVNVDSRKFVFTDIFWINRDWDFWNRNIDRELESLEERGIKDQKKRLFEIAARQLAVNAEENNRYEDAAEFRYMAMETRRLEETKKLSFSRFITWLYKWTSGYGESWTRAALVLFIVILFFGLLYWSPLSKFDYGEQTYEHLLLDVIVEESDWTKKYDARFHRMNLGEGLVHSLYVAAFQRPEPKAADTLTKFFIILETIFAPLQAALLALAIRRKFMR